MKRNYLVIVMAILYGLLDVCPSSAADIVMTHAVVQLYDNSFQLPNYYLILSTSPDASYDSKTGKLSVPDGQYALTLDLYNNASTPPTLPAGSYVPQSINVPAAPFTFDPEFSFLDFYSKGAAENSIFIKDPIQISKDDAGIYTIKTSVKNPNNENDYVNIVYRGRINLRGANDKPTVYEQINEDINASLKNGGIAYYQGVTQLSNNGVSILDIFSNDFDKETGAMLEPGWDLRMMIAHKRFVKRDAYAVVPGTYTGTTDLARDTWYPCRELEYNMGNETITLPFGSFIRKMKIVNGEKYYTYAYLKSGTFTIEEGENGKFYGKLDAVTDLGFQVSLSWEGTFILNTDNAQFETTVSNLTDDVDLDFSKITTGRIYHKGLTGGCRAFKIDLGDPAGRDEGVNYGGDLLRMEFLSPPDHSVVKPGLYTVVPQRWNDYELRGGGKYEPFSLNKGYFSDSGSMDGTRYVHCKEGSYIVYDIHAPINEGTVKVDTEDYINYRFEIKLLDDAGFEIRGLYQGPVEYHYDRNAIESEINAEVNTLSTGNIGVISTPEGLIILNAGNRKVELYNLAGTKVAVGSADRPLPTSILPKGVYILRIANFSSKITL